MQVRNIRLYIDSTIIKSQKVLLNTEQHHYLKHVMRCGNDEKINIFNEKNGEWLSAVEFDKKQSYVVPLYLKRQQNNSYENNLILCFVPTKKHSTFVLEKATELAIDSIMPIISSRSIVKTVNMEKYKKTIIEATEQSHRLSIPHLFDITNIKDIEHKFSDNLYIVCHCDGNTLKPYDLLKMTYKYKNFVLIVGPEGGWSESDIEVLKRLSNVVFLKIGSLVMRAETAAIAGITVCNLALNRI